jgi:mRNA-degrading endonuclease RelE of RelBE toxin-antitoxin system
MVQQTTLRLELEVVQVDIPDLEAAFGDNGSGLQECMVRVQEELERIRNHPDREGKECEYEPLKGFRKVKQFSSSVFQRTSGGKPDLRIIFRYDEPLDTVTVVSIGFRVKQIPRPAHDPYSKASHRVTPEP